MPLHVIRPTEYDTGGLVQRLADEVSSPGQNDPQSPLIVEQYFPNSSNFSVTVIWDEWADLPRETRGGVILDAYEQARGIESMRRISIAMGLTKSDALKIGLDPQTGLEAA